MSSSSFRPPDSTSESDYGDQSNFELSEFFTFDEWVEEDDPSSMISGSTHNPIYRAHVVSEAGGSSPHEGPTSGKQTNSLISLSRSL